MTLYLLKYNNYYNRTIKFKKNIEDYLEYMVLDNPFFNINFNPNDNVNTSQIVNLPSNAICPDYLVVCDENNTIISRWFIMESVRERKDQYTLALRRDLIVDHIEDLFKAPVFIEKAPIPISNKLIFNKEGGITYNQIKKNEYLLQDATKSGWLVGYLSDKHDQKNLNVSSADKAYPLPPISLETIEGYNRPWIMPDGQKNNMTFYGMKYVPGSDTTYWGITIYDDGTIGSKILSYPDGIIFDRLYGGVNGPNGNNINDAANALSNVAKGRVNEIRDTLSTLYINSVDGNYINAETYNTLNSMSGAIFTDEDGRTFKITVSNNKALASGEITVSSNTGAMYSLMNNIWNEAQVGASNSYDGKTPAFYCRAYPTLLNISIEYISEGADCTISTSVNKLQDAPYKMFAIPYHDINIVIQNNSTFTNNTNIAKRIATELASQYGGTGDASSIYDLQLLPYCPVRNVIQQGSIKTINVEELVENIDYTIVGVEGEPSSIILWATESSFSFNINYTINTPVDPIQFKIDNETKFVRLCSPNYSGVFEFKPTMNYGVSAFEVNCTYKPYQPYIHLSPIFNNDGLYGGEFTDQRGLVCTGDFSVPIVNDAWTNYQIQNKSYSDAFDRQIENMTTTYNINRKQAETSTLISALTAGITGAGSGALTGIKGGPIGAGIGAGVGAVGSFAASMIGRAADLKAMQALHDESLTYAKDMFGYQLQNIQALPYTLGRVGAFNINNKIFPFLEFYEASSEEENALKQKLIYNGFTVMTVGKISEYIINSSLPNGEAFIQGQLIRLENSIICDDYHILTELASEVHRGFYINNETIDGGI